MNNREEAIRLLEFNARDGKNHVQVVEHLIAELEQAEKDYASLYDQFVETEERIQKTEKERDELKDFAWQVCPLHRADDLEQLLTPKE